MAAALACDGIFRKLALVVPTDSAPAKLNAGKLIKPEIKVKKSLRIRPTENEESGSGRCLNTISLSKGLAHCKKNWLPVFLHAQDQLPFGLGDWGDGQAIPAKK